MSRKFVARLAVAGCVGLVAGAVSAGPASAGTPPSNSRSGLVFIQTNDPAGNSVDVYDRYSDGSLNPAGTYGTGGRGGLLDGPNFDQLASQGSVTYDGAQKLLYVVNAGSNTVTVFDVHGDRLRRIQVIGSVGVFPVSVAVRGPLVYVLNARDGGSIQGFLRLGGPLIRIAAWHRSLGLDTSLAPEFLSTPGDVAISPAGDKVIVTTKINGNQIDVFNLDRLGSPAATPVPTPDPGVVPFAVTFDAADHLDVAEAAGSVATYSVNRDGSLVLVERHPTNQQATCWIVSSGDHVFASNTASDTLSTYTSKAGGLADLGLTTAAGAPADSAASSDGRYLYVRTGGAGRVAEFAIGDDGALAQIGWVNIPDAVAGDGIAAS
jgi:DNA-binding beta-propeller fold protein YncE